MTEPTPNSPEFSPEALSALGHAHAFAKATLAAEPSSSSWVRDIARDFREAAAIGQADTPPAGSGIPPELWTSLKASGITPTPQMIADFGSTKLCEMAKQAMAEGQGRQDHLASLKGPAIARSLFGHASPASRRIPADAVSLFLPSREEWAQLIALLESQIEAARQVADAVAIWNAGRAEHIAAIEANTRALEANTAELRRRNDQVQEGDEWKDAGGDAGPGDEGDSD